MALNSTEDKRMTLRQICKWIEEIFPYYKCTAKPGWKVRHISIEKCGIKLDEYQVNVHEICTCES